ncbi:hypothetical protein ACFFTM_16440 [Pseudoduganella plicata]|uniref:Uncharacterized protein n=1 Tax=Pseudoduganella plicata TaxID=321984 RepID=A0A4P7BJC9_9BURK|nr:hypothetical protein [Pseudoduganella plicata]QBQ39011.1 hypothetical protein E1742_24840 [Pseudoduganella plicata]GGY86486.1 hypothetical protein GCM10007388_19670 [Pseudoduganella plicata]
MAKKAKAHVIWQAGVDAFAARRRKVEQMRRDGPARAGPQLVEPGDPLADEHLRHALLSATLPLRQELQALRDEVTALRAQVAELSKRGG